MQQLKIEARDIQPGDYLAGGVAQGPNPAQRVRRVWQALLRPELDPAACGPEAIGIPGYIVMAVSGSTHGVGARQLRQPDQTVVVWR